MMRAGTMSNKPSGSSGLVLTDFSAKLNSDFLSILTTTRPGAKPPPSFIHRPSSAVRVPESPSDISALTSTGGSPRARYLSPSGDSIHAPNPPGLADQLARAPNDVETTGAEQEAARDQDRSHDRAFFHLSISPSSSTWPVPGGSPPRRPQRRRAA